MAVPVVSEPVPAVVGTAIKGLSFDVIGLPAPRGSVKIHQFGRIDHTAATDSQKSIRCIWLGEVDGLANRVVLWLNLDFVKDLESDAFTF
ncbi:hypothetical protein AC578_2120 [Pseudocercospora eumusae]|uniref:Uncharacterized protein n=1 Tax=Pseudocercospora eumusae TaxID=321146 RepID=A0A139HQ98_9PEZI|nr:hypothetical protein AC578_2120 [Pseudocercospora eumusae]